MRRFLFIVIAAASFAGCEIRIHKKDKTKAAVTVAECTSSQRDSIYSALQPHDTNKLLTILFNPVKIVKHTAYWLPDGDAYFNMNRSADGYCHTNIDTIMQTDSNVGMCLVVFTTIPYDDSGWVCGSHPQGANYGVAIFKKREHGYEMDKFERNFTEIGTCGDKGDSIALEKFGNDTYYLMIEGGWAGGGCCIYSVCHYFSVEAEGIEKGFSYEPYYSDSLFHEDGDTSAITVEKKLVHVKTADGWRDDLKVITDLTHYSQRKQKWVTDKSEDTYRWNDKEAAYISTKNKLTRIGDDDVIE